MKSEKLKSRLLNDIEQSAPALKTEKDIFSLLVEIFTTADLDYRRVSREDWKDFVVAAHRSMRKCEVAQRRKDRFPSSAWSCTR